MNNNKRTFYSNLFSELDFLLNNKNDKPSQLFEQIKSVNNRYQNLKKISSGGSKTIYLCQDQMTDRTVAIALLKEDKDNCSIENFLREARINSMLQHPNIVPVYDTGELNGEPFFSMKYIAGQSLDDLIQARSKINLELREHLDDDLDIFLKICDAIAYAHSRSVVHLDIKPDNIRVSEFGDIILCDWGLAAILDEDPEVYDKGSSLENYSLNNFSFQNMTLHGYVKGTPGYMAPEQCQKTEVRKGKHTDIFSLGCVLYSLLCLRAPFQGHSLENILKKTQTGQFIHPRILNKQIPEQLEAVCLKAMSIEPKKRYKNVQDLKTDILAYRNGYLTSAENYSVLKAFKLMIKRNRLISLISIASFIIIFLSSFAFAIYLNQSRNSERLARLKSEELNALYEKEKRLSSKKSELLIDELTHKADFAFKKFRFQQAKENYNNILILKQDHQVALEKAAEISFIEHDFKQTLSLMKQLKDHHPLLKLVSTIAMENETSNKIPDFVQNSIIQTLLDQYGLNSSLYLNYIHYRCQNMNTVDEHLNFIRLVFKNKGISDVKFDFKSESNFLDMSHVSYSQISRLIVLNFFPAREADFSHTKLRNFQPFHGMPLKKLKVTHTDLKDLIMFNLPELEELDISHNAIRYLFNLKSSNIKVLNISHCPIDNLQPLKHMGKLEKLIVHEGQLSKNHLKSIPQHIKIETVK